MYEKDNTLSQNQIPQIYNGTDGGEPSVPYFEAEFP